MSDDKKQPQIVRRLLGRSGLRVSPFSLGCMHFGDNWTESFMKVGTTFDEAEKMVLAYVAAGGNVLDTATNYQDGQSEEWLGRIIEKNNLVRDNLVIATKFSLPVGGDANSAGNHRKNMHVAVRRSLAALKTDYLDILYVHFWDGTVDMVEVMRGLNDLVASGKVLYLGISDTPAWQVSRANAIADAHGWAPFTVYQGRYNVIDRGMENDIIPMCKALNIGVTNWSALAAGRLLKVDGKTRQNAELNEQEAAMADVVEAVANEANTDAVTVLLAWSKAKVTTVLLGPRTVKHLEGNLAALSFDLTADQIKRLDEAGSKLPGKIFPQSMLGTGIAHGWLQFMVKDKYQLEEFSL